MASQPKTPTLLRAFIAAALIAGIAVTLVCGSYVLFKMLINPPREPHYIYEPKPVKRFP
jgi:hypothetical protein